MELQQYAYLTLLIAALLDLCAMLRFDVTMLQHNEYSNKKYRNWLTESGNISSVTRILPFAVMVGACTTMARESWMVVMILAAALIIQGIVLLCKKHELELIFNMRAARLYGLTLVIALIITGIGIYSAQFMEGSSALESSAFAAMLALICLPAETMLANWLLKPVERMLDKK